jgi:hypothetical protein
MSDSQDKDQLLQDLLKRVEALEREAPKDQLTIGVMSGGSVRIFVFEARGEDLSMQLFACG